MTGVLNSIGMLCDCCAARVLEVIDPLIAHIGVLNTSEVDEQLRVLMAEKRSKEYVFLSIERAPLIGLCVFIPGSGVHRMRGGTERENNHHHRLVVAAPIGRVKSFLGIPAHCDCWRRLLSTCPF